jgi:Cu+-exporting ATPase
MSRFRKYSIELIRLSIVAVALLGSWLQLWKIIANFDFIALAATIVGGYPMFKEASGAIWKRRMTMELSMSIAVIATLIIGQFFTGLVITFFVLFAELLEHLTVNRGRNVIAELLNTLPQKVTIRRQNVEREIDTSELLLDDIVIIKPGAIIPVDGIVIKGNSSVNQSSITGESLPIDKTLNDKVYAGTINQSGILEIKTTQIGKDTTFGKIIEIIEKAERSKAPIQKVADRLAARLVYFAFLGAGLTYLFTNDIISAISALIVAGACGVAAGTPLAILAGIGRTAKNGIIVKGGMFLEELAKVDIIVLDKTGTLTLGTPRVVDVKSFDGEDIETVIQLAAIAEQHSEHPLAEAIIKKAREFNLSVPLYSDIKYYPGHGMICKARDNEILVGNHTFFQKNSIKIGQAVEEYLWQRNEKGETIILVANNKHIVGGISIADVLRDEVKQAVKEMQQLGHRVILLSGDTVNAVRAAGESLKVDESFGAMLPEQKLQKIHELISEGKKVAMIGDGVNDAPALIESSVGIAMGTGTHVALESADMTLAANNLLNVVKALKISKQCLNVIMFNFWGTIIIDTAGMTLAFLGFLTPLYAALIHVSSELVFILNSARFFRNK